MKDKLTEILVIEDNFLYRSSLAGFINKSHEFRCPYSFSTCEEAIKNIKGKNLFPDIILLDIGLPGMSGVDGIFHLKKIVQGAKIVMLTIQDDHENVFKAICNGASGYLLKDSSSEKIMESLKEVINGGAPINSSIAAKVLKMFRDFIPPQGDYNLSNREKEVLKYMAEGCTKKEIAEKIFLSYHTIDSHIRNIYQKLEVNSKSSAVAMALKENLI